jgi:nucleoside-triphosphatase THEP1
MQFGKSTFVRELIVAVGVEKPAGFFTSPIEMAGKVTGHSLCSWFGEEPHRFSSRSDSEGPFPFDVDRDVFETVGVELVRQALQAPWYVLDELGVMEKGCKAFETALQELTQKDNPGVIVVQQRALDYWCGVLGLTQWRAVVLDDKTDRCELLRLLLRHFRSIF